MSEHNAGRTPCGTYQRVNILGVGVHAITMADAIETMACWIENRIKAQVVVCTVYTIMMSRLDPDLHRIAGTAGLVTPDGMPLVILGKLMGFPHIERVYGPDLMLAFSEVMSKKGYTAYLYGGADGVPEQVAEKLVSRYPGLKIVGLVSPPYRDLTPDETTAMQDRINAANPDIIWVGLGSPKQDKWIAHNREYINAPVMIGVGAAFDFISERVPQAPRWLQRISLEWLFRLLTEPRRLWRRYLIYNTLFVINILLQLLRLRRYPLPGPASDDRD